MRKIILFVILWLLWGGVNGQAVIAQSTPPAPDDEVYDGIDVLLIIDQSGSMGGTVFGLDPQLASPPTDPQNLRFLVPQFFISELGRIRLFGVAQSMPDIHVAVLAFGDATEQLMAWTALVPEDNQGNIMRADEWERELDNLNDILSSQRFGFRNLGFTDFNNAFDSARDFFQAMPTDLAPQPGENRLRMVVIVTDGAVCTYDDIYSKVPEDPTYNCYDVLTDGTARQHMEQLAQQARTYFPAPGYQLFVVALDRDLVYADIVTPWWNDVVCQMVNCDTDLHNKIATDEIELSAQITRILKESLQNIVSDGVVTDIDITCCPPQPFTVLPYQQVLRLNILKNQPQPFANFTMTNQSTGEQIPTDPTGLETLIETRQILNPIPGQYQITGSSYDNVRDLSFNSISIAAVVKDATITPNPITALNTLSIQTEISGSTGQVLKRYFDNAGNERYPLTMELRLYQVTGYPDASDRPVVAKFPMQPDTNNPTVHRYTANYVLNDSFDGLYDLRVHATFIGDDGTTYTLLNNQLLKSNLEITGAYVDTWVLEPSSQRAQREVKARVLVLTKQGQPVSNTSTMSLRLQAIALDGTVVLQPTVFPNVSATAGIVEAGFTLNTPGGYNITAELGFTDTLGNFIALGPTGNLPIEIRPPQLVTLAITQPNPTDIIAQSFTIIPFSFVSNSSTTLQVEIRDQNGVGLDLGALINSPNALPTVQVVKDGVATDVTAQLIPISTGVYSLTTDTLGLGEYRLEASVATDQLTGDYEWATIPNTSLTFTRSISSTFYTSIAGIVVGLLLLIGVIFFFGRRIVQQSRYPLTGKITIRAYRSVDGEEYDAGETTFELNSPPRHTKTFRNRGKVKLLTVTTGPNAEYSRSGSVKIMALELDGVPVGQLSIPPVLVRGGVHELVQVPLQDGVMRYIIEKDMISWSPPTFGRSTEIDGFINLGKDTQPD